MGKPPNETDVSMHPMDGKTGVKRGRSSLETAGDSMDKGNERVVPESGSRGESGKISYASVVRQQADPWQSVSWGMGDSNDEGFMSDDDASVEDESEGPHILLSKEEKRRIRALTHSLLNYWAKMEVTLV